MPLCACVLPTTQCIVYIKCVGDFLNELSNDGAKHQFEKYVTHDILPVMVHCAQVSCVLLLNTLSV